VAALEELATWTMNPRRPLWQHRDHTSHRHRLSPRSGLTSNLTSPRTQVKDTSRLLSTATQCLLADMDGVKASTLEVKVRSLATRSLQTTSKGTKTTLLLEAMASRRLNSPRQDLMVRITRVAHTIRMIKAHLEKVAQERGALEETQGGKRWFKYPGVDGYRGSEASLAQLPDGSVHCSMSVDS